MKTTAEHFRLADSLAKLIDGALPPEETAALEEKLRTDPEAHAFAARILHLDGRLKTAAPALRNLLSDSPPPRAAASHISRIIPWSLALAATIALAFLLFSPGRDRVPAPVATLTEAKNCRWAESSLPTLTGSRIGPGFYELVEGMATLTFESGATITLEAPSTLEIIDALNCRLRNGALMADVPESAIGFTVDTPDAKIVDFGTKFGVSSGADGYYVVKVLDGLVEVTDKKDRQTKPLNGGESVSVGGQNLSEAGASSTESLHNNRPSSIPTDDGWARVTTAFGRGADTFIQLGDFTNSPSTLRDFGRHHMLRVKRADTDENTNRKAYLRFDIAGLDLSKIDKARLELTVIPGEIGFASFVPDATFTVHALSDESEDLWNETALTWQDAPAHLAGSSTHHLPDPARSTPIGSFVITQGRNHGTVSIEGEALADFLKTDTNGLATFIICRATDEIHRGGLAHEFASRENRSASPPALKLLMAE